MLKLIAMIFLAGALASSYSQFSYANEQDVEEMEDEGGDSDIDVTPAAETKPDVSTEKPAAIAAPTPKASPVAKIKAKAKKSGKNKKMAAKKQQ
ncbi:MAG: hypothetical protein SGJ18_11400 [Pseudomonadota bacterium]|nr:hypothetical protein [Pseudomonadota bacterium]